MHKIDIPAGIRARTSARRGGQSFTDAAFDPATTAHVVIDLQNGFMREGAMLEVPVAREIVENVNRISVALRAAGGHVAFTRFSYIPNESNTWCVFYDRFLNAADATGEKEAFSPGASDLQLWDALDRADGDFVVDKTRYSAFTPGTCDLPRWLKEQGIRTIIITGTLSNCCCESTARDAMQYGYEVIYVADANATLTDAEHNATLVNMMTLFADVADTETVVRAIESRAGTRMTGPI